MMRYGLLILLLATAAQGQTFPPMTTGDPRVQTLSHDPARVVRLSVAQRYQLTIVFHPDEQVENVALGDSDAWQVTLNGRGDALFLKPLRLGGSTNMTVLTDRRTYSFELTPVGALSPDTPFVVRFGDAAAQETTQAAPPTVTRYRLSGNRSIQPASVTDDGQRTIVTWRAEQDLPAVFTIDEDGREALPTGQTRDGRYIIDGVQPRLVFRLDGQTARAERPASRARR